MDTPDLVARFKRQLVEQGLMRQDEEFEHVNAVESYTTEDMSTIMHSAQGAEREFYASLLADDMEVDMEGNKQMVEQRGVAQQDMEVDENVGESQQTSSSKDLGEGTPTPRQAALPLPKPSLQPLPSGKRSLSPEEERDVAAKHNAKKVRLDTPPASNTQDTQTSEEANTGIELNDSLEDDLHFEDDEVNDDVSNSIGPYGSGTRLSSQERLRLRVLVEETRRVFLPQSPGRRKGPRNHTPGGILTPTTYAPGPAQTIVEPGPQIAGQTNEEDEPAYQVLEGDLLLELSPMDRDRPRELVKAQRWKTIVVPKSIPATHHAFIQDVCTINGGQRLTLDDHYAIQLRPLLIVSTIFATYAQHSFTTNLTVEPAFWQIVESVTAEEQGKGKGKGKGRGKKAKADAASCKDTTTRRPITTTDINDIFGHICDKVEGTFQRCKDKFRWSSHPDRGMWKNKRKERRKETTQTAAIRDDSAFMFEIHNKVWGPDPQKWTVPSGHKAAQGARYLEVDKHAGLTQFDAAVGQLQSFIAARDEEDSDAWRNFGSLRIEERYSVESTWNSALATTSLLRVRKMLSVLRDDRDSTKQLPDELEERIWWCVFLAALPLIYQESATVCMLLVEIGLEKVRRESLRLGVYDQVFHDLTLELHIILSGLTLSILKTYRRQPKSSGDDEEAEFLDRQALYTDLHAAKSYVCPGCRDKLDIIPSGGRYGEDPRPALAPPSVIELFPSIIDGLSASVIEGRERLRRNRQLADAFSHKGQRGGHNLFRKGFLESHHFPCVTQGKLRYSPVMINGLIEAGNLYHRGCHHMGQRKSSAACNMVSA